MMEAISVVMKKRRQKVAGSWKKMMPTSTVPTAPMPVHTGYAVPMGSVCVALASNHMLTAVNARNPPIHSQYARPTASLALPRQKVKPTSHKPAMTSIIQFIGQKSFLFVTYFCINEIACKVNQMVLHTQSIRHELLEGGSFFCGQMELFGWRIVLFVKRLFIN